MFEGNNLKKATILFIVLILLAIFMPTKCSAQDKMPQRAPQIENKHENNEQLKLIPIDASCVKNIFTKVSSSGKTVKYYVIYSLQGEENITTTGKSVIDYIDICNEAGISPRLALKVKNGNIISIVKAPSKIKL